jgi:hypothetical protein
VLYCWYGKEKGCCCGGKVRKRGKIIFSLCVIKYHIMKTWGIEGFVMSGLSIKYCCVTDQIKKEWQMF